MLYVSDPSERHHKVLAFDVGPGWGLSVSRDFAVMPVGVPDGMRVDERGNLWVGGGDGVDLSMLRPEVVEFVESMSDKETLPLPPPRPLDELERERVSLWQTSLKDHVWQNTAAFILGQRPFSEWDAYVAELEGMGATEYLEMVNAAQQRFAEESAG